MTPTKRENEILRRALSMVIEDFITATSGMPGKQTAKCLEESYIKLAERQVDRKAKGAK